MSPPVERLEQGGRESEGSKRVCEGSERRGSEGREEEGEVGSTACVDEGCGELGGILCY